MPTTKPVKFHIPLAVIFAAIIIVTIWHSKKNGGCGCNHSKQGGQGKGFAYPHIADL